MRLFLASQDFGNYIKELHELVGDNKKMLVVINARDAKPWKWSGSKDEKYYTDSGFETTELDLRKYFGKPEELRKYIDEFRPGQIYVLGGNSFLLMRAMAQSGLDKIIKSDIEKDKYVYSGHSAGSCVAGPDIRRQAIHGWDDKDLVLDGYQKKVVWECLGLVDFRVVPHYDLARKHDVTRELADILEKYGLKYLTLNDSDVYIVNGDKKEVLR
ncbi:hypothetical protein FACS189431_1620 [Alphaproteobacteria bacterium]|nr:hypothetical protein FACS189431_1620 [Alphaproteobacteria bacterium]